jgi:hypothetical protein
MGLVAMAYCFAKSTKIAGLQLFFGTEDKAFYETKIKTATFFFERSCRRRPPISWPSRRARVR